MDINQIQAKIDELFIENRIVFWYDKDGQFKDDVKNLSSDDFKIHHLADDNWIYTKYLLEFVDKKNKYLIYAPFSKPDDKDNNLADIVYYSKEFFADKILFVMEELNIPKKFKSTLDKYSKFFNSQKRIDSFKELNLESYSGENITIAILAVLSKVKISNFDEVLKELLTEEDLNENKFIESFRKMDILDGFWDLVSNRYSYKEDKPNLEKFFISLVLTYNYTQFNGDIPKSWEKHLLSRKNNIKVFLSNLMNNSKKKNGKSTYQEMYDSNANKIAKKFKNSLSRTPVDNYVNCDAFEIFDIEIIKYMADLLESTKEYSPNLKNLIENRAKTHFYEKFADEYSVLKWSNFLIKNINSFNRESIPHSSNEIIDKYSKDWFLIDKAYRKFYFYYIKTEDTFKSLRYLIEKMYSNNFLSKLAIKWFDSFDSNKWIDNKHVKQIDFYKKIVKPSSISHKTAVIISDAFRFECGDELKDRLNKDEHHKIVFKPMISVIPSTTEFGMASLLPHKDLIFMNSKLFIEDIPTVGLENRQKILNNHSNKVLTINSKTLIDMHYKELRTCFKDYNLIYIYHDKIDARADNKKSEDEVFIAANEAIDEIEKLIKRVSVNANIHHFIITADHGFIYRKDSLDESDKIDLENEDILLKKKRFLLSNNKLNINGTISHRISYLNNELYVTLAKGIDIFKLKGGSSNFVHGGGALQEIMLPLIEVKVKADKKECSQVELILLAPNNRKITNLDTYLTFAQSDKISDKVSPLQALIYIEDENKFKISNSVIINANNKSDDPKHREFREKITIVNKKYDKTKKYYLIVEDTNTNIEINRYEFLIDVAFADGFDF
ncbi:MAG: BREX-1 system phosphatase PglZ type A [Methanobrevibacter sp. CfCl-M3]